MYGQRRYCNIDDCTRLQRISFYMVFPKCSKWNRNQTKRDPKSIMETKLNRMGSQIDQNGTPNRPNGQKIDQNGIQNAPGGCPESLGEPGCEKERPGPETLMQLFIKLRIWGDLGNHFGSQAVPLRCQNLHSFIKYALGAIKNCVSERLKKNIKNSFIFNAIFF